LTIRSAWLALLCFAASLVTSPAVATETVVLVLAGGSAAELAPYELRVRSELLAAGFAVSAVQVPEAPDTGHLARTAGGMMTQAAVAIVLSDDSVSGAVWATSREAERTVLRTIQPEPLGKDAAAVFAIRATEVLNAVLIELGYPPRVPSDPDASHASTQPTEVSASPAPSAAPHSAKPSGPRSSPAPRSARRPVTPIPAQARPEVPPTHVSQDESAWRAGVGGVLLGGPGGIPATIAPRLALQHVPAAPWWFELAVAAPGLSTVRTATGSARVDQELVLLLLGPSHALTTWARGFIAVGGGVYRLGVQGRASPPYSGVRDQVVSATGLLGLGARIHLGGTWSLGLDAAAVLTTPRAEVVFADRVRARAGRPLLVAGASLYLGL
jgi:hypothetical protein